MFALAAWSTASVFLYALTVLWPAATGSELMVSTRGVRGLTSLALVCLPAFVLVGSVLYCWGAQWSRERHVAIALACSVGAAVLAVPLTLASVCAVEGNCL
jgi:hypothetical protein